MIPTIPTHRPMKTAINRRDLINYCLYAALILAIAAIFYYGGK